jgi:hypothetical protein
MKWKTSFPKTLLYDCLKRTKGDNRKFPVSNSVTVAT